MKSEVHTKYKPIKGIPDKGPSEGREEGLRCSIEIMQETNFLRDSAKKKLMEKYSCQRRRRKRNFCCTGSK